MPMYEYACGSCGHQDTLLAKIGAAARRKCPSCGKARSFAKQLSAPSFQLKGTGWYATDFRDNGKKESKSAEGDKGDVAKAGDGGNGEAAKSGDGGASDAGNGKPDSKTPSKERKTKEKAEA